MKKILVFFFTLLYFTTSSADTAKLKNDFYNALEKFLNGNFDYTDFSLKSREDNKPEIGILTLKPLEDLENELTFLQGSIFTHDGDRETLNLGLGKRRLSEDESFLFGLNAFYDREIDYNHQRGSLGGEIKSSILELNANNYFSISDQRVGKNDVIEEVADGYDLEIGSHIPHVPSAKIYAKIFEYEIPGGSDFEGMEYSSSIDVPNSGVNFEVGFKNFGNNSYDDQWFFNLTFSLNKVNPDKEFVTEEAYEKTSMKEKKYAKVRRENIIVKSKGFAVKAGGF